jgi:hypothetical protein
MVKNIGTYKGNRNDNCREPKGAFTNVLISSPYSLFRRFCREGEAMKLRLDTRRFSNATDRDGSCRKCGCQLILLPRDRRRGYCFDCFDPLPVDDSALEAT